MEWDSIESYADILGFWQKSTYNSGVYLCSHMKFFIWKQGSEIWYNFITISKIHEYLKQNQPPAHPEPMTNPPQKKKKKKNKTKS